MADIIDLRSDTVTVPTQEMRQAMYDAEVGDDVMGEDPTVNRLQELAAEVTGKEAALLVVSGTMGNLVSILTHCGRGSEVIMGDNSHAFFYEVGGAAALGGLPVRTVPNEKFGTLSRSALEQAIRGDNIHFPPTGLICIENTHNRCGGTVLRPEQMEETASVARRHGIPIHLDGARVFNAACYLETDVREITQHVDSLMFCLSKGLSAPVGSMVAGTKDFIERAKKNRKMVGGGMRQAGVLAAAGIIALTKMLERLPDDHANARRLAAGLAEMAGLDVDMETVQTNIVVFSLVKPGLAADEFQRRMCAQGVRVSLFGGPKVRMVTHHGIESAGIDRALLAVKRALSE